MSITYSFFADGKERICKNSACFADMRMYNYNNHLNGVSNVVDFCKVDVRNDKKAINFYLDFLAQILNPEYFTIAKTVTAEEIEKYDLHESWVKTGVYKFTLAAGKLTHAQTLLYLTAFRYLEEFARAVNYFYKQFEGNLDATVEDKFNVFIKMHVDFSMQRGINEPLREFYLGHSHTLANYYMYSNITESTQINLEQFRKKLSDKSVGTVWAHFRV